MRDARRGARSLLGCLTCVLPGLEGPCLHLDQGSPENSDDAFPLVVLADRCANRPKVSVQALQLAV